MDTGAGHGSLGFSKEMAYCGNVMVWRPLLFLESQCPASLLLQPKKLTESYTALVAS